MKTQLDRLVNDSEKQCNISDDMLRLAKKLSEEGHHELWGLLMDIQLKHMRLIHDNQQHIRQLVNAISQTIQERNCLISKLIKSDK